MKLRLAVTVATDRRQTWQTTLCAPCHAAVQSVFHVTALRGLFPEGYYREITMRNLEGVLTAHAFKHSPVAVKTSPAAHMVLTGALQLGLPFSA